MYFGNNKINESDAVNWFLDVYIILWMNAIYLLNDFVYSDFMSLRKEQMRYLKYDFMNIHTFELFIENQKKNWLSN